MNGLEGPFSSRNALRIQKPSGFAQEFLTNHVIVARTPAAESADYGCFQMSPRNLSLLKIALLLWNCSWLPMLLETLHFSQVSCSVQNNERKLVIRRRKKYPVIKKNNYLIKNFNRKISMYLPPLHTHNIDGVQSGEQVSSLSCITDNDRKAVEMKTSCFRHLLVNLTFYVKYKYTFFSSFSLLLALPFSIPGHICFPFLIFLFAVYLEERRKICMRHL